MTKREDILDQGTFFQYVSPGDVQSLGRILNLFKFQIDRNLNDLRHALQNGDLVQTDQALHKMKGTTAFIGAAHMLALTRQVMEAPVHRRLPEARSLVPELETGLLKTIEAMQGAC